MRPPTKRATNIHRPQINKGHVHGIWKLRNIRDGEQGGNARRLQLQPTELTLKDQAEVLKYQVITTGNFLRT